jgi:hypothetical protein
MAAIKCADVLKDEIMALGNTSVLLDKIQDVTSTDSNRIFASL